MHGRTDEIMKRKFPLKSSHLTHPISPSDLATWELYPYPPPAYLSAMSKARRVCGAEEERNSSQNTGLGGPRPRYVVTPAERPVGQARSPGMALAPWSVARANINTYMCAHICSREGAGRGGKRGLRERTIALALPNGFNVGVGRTRYRTQPPRS